MNASDRYEAYQTLNRGILGAIQQQPKSETIWQKESPKTVGFYWFKRNPKCFPLMRLIIERNGELLACEQYPEEIGTKLEHLVGAEWAGPIFPPK